MTPTQALEALERVREGLAKERLNRNFNDYALFVDRDGYRVLKEAEKATEQALLELPAAISALKAMVGEVDEARADRCPITPASLALHQELFDMGRKHERESSTPLRPPVEQQTVSLEAGAKALSWHKDRGNLDCARELAKAWGLTYVD